MQIMKLQQKSISTQDKCSVSLKSQAYYKSITRSQDCLLLSLDIAEEEKVDGCY